MSRLISFKPAITSLDAASIPFFTKTTLVLGLILENDLVIKAFASTVDVVVPSPILLDVPKPRDTKTRDNTLVPFEMGNLVKVNNVYGTPYINLTDSDNKIQLYNQRTSSTSSGTGTWIGKARVYSFGLSDSPYEDNSTSWDLYLYDVQTFTKLILNELPSNNLIEGSYLRGANSGASGHVQSISGKTVYLIQTSGKFSVGESLYINESLVDSRSIVSIQDYSVDDIKSVWQDCTTITSNDLKTDFVADTILTKQISSRFNITDQITISPTGSVTCPGRNFLGIRSDSIIQYQISGQSLETFNRVDSVSSDGLAMSLGQCPSVTNVCSGSFPGITTSVTFKLGVPNIKDDVSSSLYSPLFDKNISTVNLSSASLTINSQIFTNVRKITLPINQYPNPNATLKGIAILYFDQNKVVI
jgi:hypothetical protein